MDLSKPHFGIHGTNAPETIGYTTSSGCIRLTNWDALDLGGRIEKGVPVEFRDTVNRSDDSQSNSNKKTG
jgi:lipoprotein-anchoring transpeptidase ErfK/SrfK